jgi:hypothetical protein
MASVYDREQGHATGDPQRERKGALMAALFAANLELNARRQGAPGGPRAPSAREDR